MGRRTGRKKLSGAAKLKASGRRAITLGVTHEQLAQIKAAAKQKMSPVSRFILSAVMFAIRQMKEDFGSDD